MNFGDNIFLIFYYCSPNYFKIEFKSYAKYTYELIYENGTWSKIKKILSCNSDTNDKDIVNIDGNLFVTGYINGTTSLAGGIAHNFTYKLDDIKINKLVGYKLIAESSTNLSPTNPLNFYTAGFSYYDGFNGYQFICPYTTNNPLFYIRHLHNFEGETNDSPWFRLPVVDELINSKNIAQNSYIKFGALFGGLLIQWGMNDMAQNWDVANNIITIAFPISFTTTTRTVVANHNDAENANTNVLISSKNAQNSLSSCVFRRYSVDDANQFYGEFCWTAIGY